MVVLTLLINYSAVAIAITFLLSVHLLLAYLCSLLF